MLGLDIELFPWPKAKVFIKILPFVPLGRGEGGSSFKRGRSPLFFISPPRLPGEGEKGGEVQKVEVSLRY